MLWPRLFRTVHGLAHDHFAPHMVFYDLRYLSSASIPRIISVRSRTQKRPIAHIIMGASIMLFPVIISRSFLTSIDLNNPG